MKGNVSIKTIAEETGFSVSTVSRVMNGHAREFRISEETEELILKTSDKFNYKPNPIAVNLRMKKSFTIGLVIPSLNNPFFVNVTSILNSGLAQKGYSIILTESNDDLQSEEKLIKQLLNRNIDGLLLIPSKERDKNKDLLEDAFADGLPILCIDRYLKDSIIPYITTNNEKGAYQGVKHLIEKGHKKIACIQGLETSSPSIDRKKGYIRAVREQGLEPFYIGGDAFTIECGYRETVKLWELEKKPTAIFAMSSTIALGIMRAAKEKRITIPEELSLIGFDNYIFLDYLSVPLTTIAQPVKSISEAAVKVLLNHINGNKSIEEWESTLLDTKLIQRDSVAPVL